MSEVAIPSAGDLVANITEFKQGMKVVMARQGQICRWGYHLRRGKCEIMRYMGFSLRGDVLSKGEKRRNKDNGQEREQGRQMKKYADMQGTVCFHEQ